MNGSVLAGTSIAVDVWQAGKQAGTKLFFLTHLHGDHVVGLTSSWRRPIYCSPVTAQLLLDRYGLDRSIVRSLAVDQTHLVTCCQGNCLHTQGPGGSEKQRVCDTVSVTVIDANHCPGAVMFLFEGSFGKILHTGDFRFSPSMVARGSLLSEHVGSIDRLYLDNTYCSPKCLFPSREEALEEIVRLVKGHADHDVVLGIRGLGKEELLAAVALAVGERVNVPPLTLSVVSALDFPDLFTTGQPHQRLRVAPFHHISSDYVKRFNQKKPTIVILPTALYHGIGGKPYANVPEVFVVPYSDHSSYPELHQFVSALKPARVLPIVQGKARGPFGVDISSRADMTCFHQYLSRPRKAQSAHTSQCDRAGSGGQNASCGFQNLFPDFLHDPLPTLKRKPSVQKRPRKVLCPMGVNYLSDEDEERGEQRQSAQRLPERTTSNMDSPGTHQRGQQRQSAQRLAERTTSNMDSPGTHQRGEQRQSAQRLPERTTSNMDSPGTHQRGEQRQSAQRLPERTTSNMDSPGTHHASLSDGTAQGHVQLENRARVNGLDDEVICLEAAVGGGESNVEAFHRDEDSSSVKTHGGSKVSGLVPPQAVSEGSKVSCPVHDDGSGRQKAGCPVSVPLQNQTPPQQTTATVSNQSAFTAVKRKPPIAVTVLSHDSGLRKVKPCVRPQTSEPTYVTVGLPCGEKTAPNKPLLAHCRSMYRSAGRVVSPTASVSQCPSHKVKQGGVTAANVTLTVQKYLACRSRQTAIQSAAQQRAKLRQTYVALGKRRKDKACVLSGVVCGKKSKG